VAASVQDNGAGARESDDHSAPDVVDVRLLGPVTVMLGTDALDLGADRASKLFAVLALSANSTVSFAQIVDAVWDEPPGSVRQQVHNLVAALRRTLAPAAGRLDLVTSRGGYQMRMPASDVDVVRFQLLLTASAQAEAKGLIPDAADSLQRAMSEWRGPAFGGLESTHLQNAAAALAEEKLAAAEHLAQLQLRLGDASTPTRSLPELVAENPYRESLRATLMMALHASGRQVDALAVFDQGRRLLADELGLDPGPELRTAQQRVLRGAPSERLHSASPGPEFGQAFLPRDIYEFTGRADELRDLKAHARRSDKAALVITAIDGMGGVGKTTLAVHLAHELAPHYPDGQYFIDLRGYAATARPLSAFQALTTLLRSCGILPELIPQEHDVCVALWRSRVAGRRILLLLDNAEGVEQVRDLLPGTPGALVLISSRHRMPSLEGAMALSLDVMPFPDAMALFAQIVGAERAAAEADAAATVVRLCGCLPLAVQVAAGRLRDRPGWSIAHLADQLQGQEGRARLLAAGDRDVMGILSWSYRNLTQSQQRLFRLLSIHPGPDFDAHAAAALAGLSLDETVIILEHLVDVNLLQQPSPGRYRFHELVHDSARSKLEQQRDDAEQVTSALRTIDYYLRSVSVWCNLIGRTFWHLEADVDFSPDAVKEPETSGAAAVLLDEEYLNIVAAIRLAADVGAHRRCWQLTCSLLPYFARLNNGPEIDGLLEQALLSAKADESELGQSACLTGLSRAKSARGLKGEAIDLAIGAVELSRSSGSHVMEISQRTGLGVCYYLANRIDEAVSCFTEALEQALEVGSVQAEASLTNNLGVICQELGQFDEAMAYYRRTYEVGERAGAPDARVHALNNLGMVLCLQGKYGASSAKFEDALHMSRAVSNPHGEAEALIGLCVAHRGIHDHVRSMRFGRAALEIARNLARYDLECEALNAIADGLLVENKIDEADAVYSQAHEVASKFRSERHLARIHEGRAHVMVKRFKLEAARDEWQQAVSVYPGGVADPVAAKLHLAAFWDTTVTCWRCDA
jgi:DNA-binding SARP family transcriptional activator/Tfp pilus assembly protein PilF